MVYRWLQEKAIDSALWTAIPTKWDDIEGRIPTAADVVSYLRSRNDTEAGAAEEYIRRAPSQIRTRYRAIIEGELGWNSV